MLFIKSGKTVIPFSGTVAGAIQKAKKLEFKTFSIIRGYVISNWMLSMKGTWYDYGPRNGRQ